MQQTWRQDPDKLTFITCTPLPASHATATNIRAQQHDGPSAMLGDVNLFLTWGEYERSDDVDISACAQPSTAGGEERDGSGGGEVPIGELELMIARPENQGQGHGVASLRAFMAYIRNHEVEILREFVAARVVDGRVESEAGSTRLEELRLGHLRVKIGQENARSIALFEKVGFRAVGTPDWFGEVEMRMSRDGWEDDGRIEGMGMVEGYREMKYLN